MDKNNNIEKRPTRVSLYSDLRDKIDKMDTLSFDDPNRDEKYSLHNKENGPIIHEVGLSSEELRKPHIKKNTLSISIEDLIKQNDDYTIALEKKDLDKSFKQIKRKSKVKFSKKLIISISSVVLLLIIAIIVFCVLYF